MNRVDGGVYVGSSRAPFREEALDRNEIDHVVSLTPSEYNTTTHHHPLTDGENDQSDFDAAVDTVRELLESADGMLVHCNAGMSRSPAVLATALAAERDLRFDEGVGLVRNSGRNIQIAPELRDHAKTYLDESGY